MKKILITALAALFVFTSCNLEGEEPLEDGVMTPKEFFKKIEVSDPAELVDGWWHLNSGLLFEKDVHGNYKQETVIGTPTHKYYFHLNNGQITSIKRRKIVYDGWEVIAINDPTGVKINKEERKFSLNVIDDQYHQSISNEDIVQCKNDSIITIDLGSGEKDKNGKMLYRGHSFQNIDNVSPTWWNPSPADE